MNQNEVKLFGDIKISFPCVKIPMKLVNTINGDLTNFITQQKKISIGKPIVNENGENITSEVIGASQYIENGTAVANKFYIYTKDKNYLASFPLK